MHERINNLDDFDLHRDVVGEDLVAGGVVYSSTEWVYDHEDGVRRRAEVGETEERETLAEVEQGMAQELRSRAATLAADYAATAANLSTGSTISELRDRHAALLREADSVGFDIDIIEKIIDTALSPAEQR